MERNEDQRRIEDLLGLVRHSSSTLHTVEAELQSLLSKDQKSKRHPMSICGWDNGPCAVISLSVLSLATCSLCADWAVGSYAVLIGDSYLLLLLIVISSGKGWKIVPERFWAVVMAAVLLVAFVCSFASMYLRTHHVCKQGEPLCTRTQAIYFSAVTMTTVGYGDYVAEESDAQLLVVWQLASGALLLLLIVPVLASRLALFPEKLPPG